jgi:archaellum component FlaF (FlaF/FlaG flagellin family)
MGFSLVAAAAIIGVSILVCAEVIVGNLTPTAKDINDSYDDMKDRAIDKIQTDINITSATTSDILTLLWKTQVASL